MIQSTDIEIANVAKRDAGFGHFPMLEAPERFNPVLLEVLDRLAAES